jgi:GNAT superfamily N-acetyltransferase
MACAEAAVRIRRIRGDEWPALRALRLQALADSPTAFGSTLAREEAFSDSVWRERAAESADRVTFVAERDGVWIGIATGLAADPDGDAGPVLVGMFVAAEGRRARAGTGLVEAVAGWASARGDARLRLWVTASNDPAVGLYRRCRFSPTGRSRPVGHTPSLIEIEMALALG